MDPMIPEIMDRLRNIINETQILENQVQRLKDIVVSSEHELLKIKEGVLEGFHYINSKVNNLEKVIMEINSKVDKLLEKK
ncbi:MAG: hypothetical protein N2712_01380 [Brevinematales bacterium]|nr:hypothetical protein [Brevinematales bacterium]